MEGSNVLPATSTFMQEGYRCRSDRGKERSRAGFRNAVILSEKSDNFVRHWRQECRS